MTKNFIFFSKETDLCNLTGLDHDQLWEAGFNLDDWDFGFVTDSPLSHDWSGAAYEAWLDERMDCYCFGSRHVVYNGKHYYMAYHS